MKKYIIIFCFYNALFAALISKYSSRPVAERPVLHEGHQLDPSVIRQIQSREKPKEVIEFNDVIQTKINKIINRAERLDRLEKPNKYITQINTIKNSLADSADISKSQERINYLLKKAERAADPSLARRTHRFIQKKLGIRKKQEKVEDSFIEIQGKKVEPNKRSDVENLRNLLSSDGVALKPSQIKKIESNKIAKKEDFEVINDKIVEALQSAAQKRPVPAPRKDREIQLQSAQKRPVPPAKPEHLRRERILLEASAA